jgi:hypothetical protein
MLRKITMLTLNADNVTFLIQASSRGNKAATSLLHMISLYVPGMFDVAISSLETHLLDKIEAFVQGTSSSLTETLKLICRLDLRRIATSKRQIHKSSQSSLREIRQHLLSICAGSTKEFSGRKKRVQDFTSTWCSSAYISFLIQLLRVLTRIAYITHNVYHCHFHVSPINRAFSLFLGYAINRHDARTQVRIASSHLEPYFRTSWMRRI